MSAPFTSNQGGVLPPGTHVRADEEFIVIADDWGHVAVAWSEPWPWMTAAGTSWDRWHEFGGSTP